MGYFNFRIVQIHNFHHKLTQFTGRSSIKQSMLNLLRSLKHVRNSFVFSFLSKFTFLK